MPALTILAVSSISIWAQLAAPNCGIQKTAHGARVTSNAGTIDLEMLAPNILRVDVQSDGKTSPRTLVMDPDLKPAENFQVSIRKNGESLFIGAPGLRVSITCASPLRISVFDVAQRKLVEQIDPLGQATWHSAVFLHAPDENLYGMSGLSMRENGGALLRNNGSIVAAGSQGEAGAPWFFTTHYGVLIDSDGGTFNTRDDEVQFNGVSRQDVEYFVIAGRPMEVASGLAKLTGHPPLPPKWSLGFMNSQWGLTEAEVKQIIATYRAKRIPIDAFIMDFDWKAWGEDNYGEWRWNSTSAPGNSYPDKFPDGASGEFAKELRAEGVKLVGILKPRILLYNKGTTTEMEAAAYAQAHGLWYPEESRSGAHFSGPPTRDLDFSNAETRSWFWKHLEPAFDSGIVGWWNDEADVGFNNFQFLNMGRMLHDGQRQYSDTRVWSLNRNYYLGAQRYGYAEWSGDIQTGFQSMQHQRTRMLATIDTGESHWSMDTGGFFGHPSPQNYARWMEFAAFVPIDRVHDDLGEKRQPWVYGPVAEAASTRAIRLRYVLLPYIYSYERVTTETGIGVVRPLFWAFPDDQKLVNDCSSWMFGDAFLVSPVAAPDESVHSVYLPDGMWYDYTRGTRFQGGQTIHYKVDPKTWQDIPLFVRSGSIIASQPPQDYVGQHPVAEITLDVFPAAHQSQFVYYDDDGETYAYEHGVYYRQVISASAGADSTHLQFDKPSGSFQPALNSYIVHIHGIAARTVALNGMALSKASSGNLQNSAEENNWTTGQDRFGVLTTIRIPANQVSSIVLH
ncbi:MAG: TIM-barrel domain-containing protein [Acidobacteriaceae bacterium]